MKPETADIKGTIIVRNDLLGESPIVGATVTLQMETAYDEWQTSGEPTITDEIGRYLFEKVDIGSSPDGLFADSGRFRLEVDASGEGILPPGWTHDDILYRYVEKIPRTGGQPIAEFTKLDIVFS